MCVCCSVLQSYVAACCSHMLFVEMEEGGDECVCVKCVVVICVAAWVAVCCRYMHCSVCYGVLQLYVLQFVLQCAAVICAVVCVAVCCSHMCCSVCCNVLQ